ncbi:DUF4386 domain-containing protein [Kibdelosporangium aridum]|uniref:DUF4386 domain-containing protein n=1 Tax=Kibdelosporangium aridum TaxID=2030 RepID=UPI0035EA9994
MTIRKTSARVVGALFVTATAAGVVSAVLLGPGDQASTPASAGALMVLIMAVAIAMIPPVLFPILKEHNEALALGYVVARTLEVVLVLPATVGPLMSLSGAPDDIVRIVTGTYDVWGHPGSMVFFCLGAAILNVLLFRSGLVPRWISGWALIAVLPYLADAGLVMFGALAPFSAIHSVLVIPLALNEMVLAGWLLTRGFAVTTAGAGYKRR